MPKQKQKTIFVHSMFSTCIFLVLKSVINEQSVSYYGLTDSRMSASEKDLPVLKKNIEAF